MTSNPHTSAIAVLRDEYAGDDAFLNLVDLLRPAWRQRSDRAQYVAAFGDVEIAIVLAGNMGQHAFEWFHEKIPALDQRSAADVLQNEREGPRIIRSLLLRMPE
jgi:hypothetical protein